MAGGLFKPGFRKAGAPAQRADETLPETPTGKQPEGSKPLRDDEATKQFATQGSGPTTADLQKTLDDMTAEEHEGGEKRDEIRPPSNAPRADTAAAAAAEEGERPNLTTEEVEHGLGMLRKALDAWQKLPSLHDVEAQIDHVRAVTLEASGLATRVRISMNDPELVQRADRMEELLVGFRDKIEARVLIRQAAEGTPFADRRVTDILRLLESEASAEAIADYETKLQALEPSDKRMESELMAFYKAIENGKARIESTAQRQLAELERQMYSWRYLSESRAIEEMPKLEQAIAELEALFGPNGLDQALQKRASDAWGQLVEMRDKALLAQALAPDSATMIEYRIRNYDRQRAEEVLGKVLSITDKIKSSKPFTDTINLIKRKLEERLEALKKRDRDSKAPTVAGVPSPIPPAPKPGANTLIRSPASPKDPPKNPRERKPAREPTPVPDAPVKLAEPKKPMGWQARTLWTILALALLGGLVTACILGYGFVEREYWPGPVATAADAGTDSDDAASEDSEEADEERESEDEPATARREPAPPPPALPPPPVPTARVSTLHCVPAPTSAVCVGRGPLTRLEAGRLDPRHGTFNCSGASDPYFPGTRMVNVCAEGCTYCRE